MFTRSKETFVPSFMSFAGKGNFLAAAQGPSVCFTLIDGISRTTLPGQFKPGQAGSGRAAPRSYSGHRWKKLHKHQFFSKGGSAAVSPLPGILRMGRALVKKNLQRNQAAVIHDATCGTSPCSRWLSKQGCLDQPLDLLVWTCWSKQNLGLRYLICFHHTGWLACRYWMKLGRK